MHYNFLLPHFLMSKETPSTVDYELQIKTLKRSINDLTFTLEEKDREIERLKAKVYKKSTQFFLILYDNLKIIIS